MLVPIATRLAWPLLPPPLAQRPWDGDHLVKGELEADEVAAQPINQAGWQCALVGPGEPQLMPVILIVTASALSNSLA